MLTKSEDPLIVPVINVCECEICKSVLEQRKSRLPLKVENYVEIVERNMKYFPEEVCMKLNKLLIAEESEPESSESEMSYLRSGCRK